MNHLLFLNLSPVIQVFIGFYFLLFFEQVLKCSPLKQKEKEIEDALYAFISRFQQFFPTTNDCNERYWERLNDFLEKEEKRWGLFYKTLQDVGTFLFLYSLFLLVYAGLEECFSKSIFSPEYFYGMGVFVASYVVFYVLMVSLFYSIRIFRSFLIYRAILFFILLLLLLVFLYNDESLRGFLVEIFSNIREPLRYFLVVFLCIIACSSGFIVLCLRLWYLDCHFKSFKRKIERTSEYANLIIDVRLGITAPEKLKNAEIEEKIKKKKKRCLKKMIDSYVSYLDARSIPLTSKNFFQEEFFREEIQKTFDSLIRERSVWKSVWKGIKTLLKRIKE